MTTFAWLVFATVALGIIVLLLLIWIWLLEARIKRLLRGSRAADLEDVMIDLGRNLESLENRHDNLLNFAEDMDKRLRKAVQRVHTVRFNPFRDQGGNHSFAVCLADEEGTGVIFSSLYSRDQVSVFAKPIIKGQSEYELSNEEREAVKQAIIVAK